MTRHQVSLRNWRAERMAQASIETSLAWICTGAELITAIQGRTVQPGKGLAADMSRDEAERWDLLSWYPFDRGLQTPVLLETRP